LEVNHHLQRILVIDFSEKERQLQPERFPKTKVTVRPPVDGKIENGKNFNRL
jgi:hypothetical protein